MDYSNLTIEQIDSIEIIEWNLSNYWNVRFDYSIMENQFDLIFLDFEITPEIYQPLTFPIKQITN